MKPESDHEQRLIQYLLGALAPAEQEELEERYFSDPALHEEIEATADDLIHSYLSGGLSAAERERFDSHFLTSPRQRERLELVRAIVARVGRPSAASGAVSRRARPPAWMAATAAGLAVIALASWLLRRSPPAPEPQSATMSPGGRPSPVRPTTTPGPIVPEAPVVRLGRGTAQLDVVVPQGASSVRFEVAVDGAHASYDALLRDVRGVEVVHLRDLEVQRDGAPLVFSLPAKALTAAAYVLTLHGESLRSNQPPSDPVVKCTLRVRRSS